MPDKFGARAASLPEMLLIVCLVALFGGAALQELSARTSAAHAQSQNGAAANPAGSPAPKSGVSAPTTPPAKPQTVAEKIAASQQLLDINTATAGQLKALPGMGEAYAARVIAGRPYTAKNQLATRGILPKDEYERIRPLIVAHRPKS